MRHLIHLLIFNIAWAVIAFPGSINDTVRKHYPKPGIYRAPMALQCLAVSDLDKSLNTLRSYLAGPELAEVENSLLTDAKRSPECRQQIIQVLTTAMSQPHSGLSVDSQTYSLWRNGAGLLAELSAAEALDLLVINLGVTDGLSTSLSHYPAVDAVIRIGEPAIPKLQGILSNHSNEGLRRLAAFCIASIGGQEARDVLTKSLAAETEPCLSDFIRISIRAFDNKERPNRIPPSENGKWHSAFYCLQ